MKSFRKHLIATAIALGLSASALAADTAVPDPMGPTPWVGMGQMNRAQMTERMKARMEYRYSILHQHLKLTADQEPAWQEFVAGAKPPMINMYAQRADMWKLSAPDRMEKMIEYMKQREAYMTERLAALKKFYAVLTPEQQKIFDAEHMGPRGPMKRGAMRGRMGGMGMKGGMGPGMGSGPAPASGTN